MGHGRAVAGQRHRGHRTFIAARSPLAARGSVRSRIWYHDWRQGLDLDDERAGATDPDPDAIDLAASRHAGTVG